MPGTVQRPVRLALFGKHPGWDDHMEYMDHAGDSLVRLKMLLYREGIGGLIDSGVMDKAGPGDRPAGFHQVFLIRQPVFHSLAAGRMWPSRDGKGRDRYPLLAVTEGDPASLDRLVLRLERPLLEMEQACGQTENAADVIAMVNRYAGIMDTMGGEAPPAPNQAMDAMAQLKGAEADHEGFARFIYRLQRECQPWMAGGAGNPSTRHIRMPVSARDFGASLSSWYHVLDRLLKPETPLALFRPIEQPWIDMLIGDAKGKDFRFLLSGTSEIPVTSDIPYPLTPEDRDRLLCWAHEQCSRTGVVKPKDSRAIAVLLGWFPWWKKSGEPLA